MRLKNQELLRATRPSHAVAVILLRKMPRLLELFCGTKSVGRAFEAAGWEVVSLDIVSKFEPTILCDIRSWDYATFPGHFADDAPAAAPGGRRAGAQRP